MSEDSILETIDNALADYELSQDAMRWSPEPVKTEDIVPTPITRDNVNSHIEELRNRGLIDEDVIPRPIWSFIDGWE